ncbi:MAG: hypothetical protein N4A71_22160 [Carboxylicivirga sp.]|jgi:hypothetical protein|nr:hypothetical protein [Carboxylicivirga sp.]
MKKYLGLLGLLVLSFLKISSQDNTSRFINIQPRFHGAKGEQSKEVTNKFGIAYGESESEVDPYDGIIYHSNISSSELLGGVSMGVIDGITESFTVPYTGKYKITFKGTIEGGFYNISSSYKVGVSQGATKLWLSAGLKEQSESYVNFDIYETDMSNGALYEELAETAIFDLLGIGDVASAINTIKSIAIPEKAFDSHKFEVEVNALLEADYDYNWAFRALSSTACASAGVASNVSLLDVDIRLENIELEYIDNFQPTLSDEAFTYNWQNESCKF